MVEYTIAELVELRDLKLSAHNTAFNYYDSVKAPSYLNKRLSDFFAQNQHYTQNWMSLVVDSVRNKLLIEGLVVSDDDSRTQQMTKIWDDAQMACEADMVHEYCHICGESFLIAGLDSTGNPVAYANDPRAVVVVYGGDNPREITQACKFWLDGQTHMATVWTLQDGRVAEETFLGQKTQEKDEERAKKEQALSYTREWEPVFTNYTQIPVFHFRRSARNIKPEFYQVTSLQDTINKIFVTLGFSIENAADRIKWAITNSDLSDANRARAGDFVTIPPGSPNEQNVSVGEFTEADLTKLSSLIPQITGQIASITQTPGHYFNDSMGDSISGEALQAFEAPLIAKIKRYIRRHAAVWESAGAFLLTLSGKPTTTSEVTCNYADPRTTLTISQAQSRQTNVTAGIPIITQLRDEGWRKEDLDQLLADKAEMEGIVLDDAAREQVYQQMADRASAQMQPMITTALQLIADAATDKIINDDKLMMRLAEQARPSGTVTSEN